MSMFKHAHPYSCATPDALHVGLDLSHETEWENHTADSLREGRSKKRKKNNNKCSWQRCSEVFI